MKKIKDLIKTIIDKTGYTITRTDVRMDFISWAKDIDFENAYKKVSPYTMLERDRLFMLWQFARQAKRFSGAMAQVGVFRGGSARLIAHAKEGNGKKFYLFDTFKGMPKVNEKIDLHKEGDFINTSLEGVKDIFKDAKDIVFCPGFFPDTSTPAQNEIFSFVYIDVDIYQSTLDSLNFFYPKMLKGGFMFFDDYMGKNTPGVKKALDEFLIDKKEIPIITTVGQCVLIKQ
jgi:hypothetical protein